MTVDWEVETAHSHPASFNKLLDPHEGVCVASGVAEQRSDNGAEERMTTRRRELYRSSNGDRWLLARDTESGEVFVRHEANPASGGQSTHIDIGTFLFQGGHGPEHQELLRLIGTLVEE